MEQTHPILYSFRRCPYAMRARMALMYAGINPEIREIVFKDKPEHMLNASPKGTVPVLILPDGSKHSVYATAQQKVIDESLDIIKFTGANFSKSDALLIQKNDTEFKAALDRYKYPVRYDDVDDPLPYREKGVEFLSDLNAILSTQKFLGGAEMGFTDMAIFPFVRQFSGVEPDWFNALDLPEMRSWLKTCIESDLFRSVMKKYPVWQDGDEPVFLISA